MAAVADLGYADCTATAWRPPYLPPGSPRAALAQPAWVQARRRPPGARAADDPLARRRRDGRCSAPLPPVVHVHFHDYELLETRRRAALVATLVLLARRRRPVGARRARAPSARSAGTPYAPADRASPAARAALAGCGSSSGRRAGSRSGSTRTRSGVTILRDGKTVVAEDARPAPLRARPDRRRSTR